MWKNIELEKNKLKQIIKEKEEFNKTMARGVKEFIKEFKK